MNNYAWALVIIFLLGTIAGIGRETKKNQPRDLQTVGILAVLLVNALSIFLVYKTYYHE